MHALRFLMCPLWSERMRIIRDKSSKVRQQIFLGSNFAVSDEMLIVLQWYVSYEEVARAGPPGQETYPPSCSGWLWVTSPGTARALATAAQQVNTVTALYDPIERSIYK